MGIKIQINSLEALERLIGGDSEVEIEIRNSIVDIFTKKHLKSLATSDLVLKAERVIIAEVQATFFEETKSFGIFNSTKLFFKKEVLDKLKEDILHMADIELSKVVREAIEAKKSTDSIEEALGSATEKILNQLSDNNLEERLNRMVDSRLKEKLGIK